MKKTIFRAALAVLLALTGTAGAETFPDRTLTMIIPFAAGGPTDVLGRIMAQAHGRNSRPDGDRREHRRRRRHDRRQESGRRQARRLHHAARHRRHAGARPDALQASALQRGHRLHASRADRRSSDRVDRAARLSGRQPERFRRLREGQCVEDDFRFGRRGLGHASRLRRRRSGDGNKYHARPLQGLGAGDDRPDQRPHRLLLRGALHREGADRQPQGKGYRAHDHAALAGRAQRSDRARNRASRASRPIPGTRSSCRRARRPTSSKSSTTRR